MGARSVRPRAVKAATLEAIGLTLAIVAARPIWAGARRGTQILAVEISSARIPETGVGAVPRPPVPVVAAPEAAQTPTAARGSAGAGTETVLGGQTKTRGTPARETGPPVPVPLPPTAASGRVAG